MELSFAISDWSGWCSNQAADLNIPYTAKLISSDCPDASAMPPMIRRKLNLLGRACAGVVMKLIPQDIDVPIVYCSQHGDIDRTMNVLNDLTIGEPISPTNFSLAVHNAICGVISIHTNNNASISALSFGQEGLIPVLLEAMGFMDAGDSSVLCILCDTSLPEIFHDSCAYIEIPYAAAFMLNKEEGIGLELNQRPNDSETKALLLGGCEALKFMEFLESDRLEFLTMHNDCLWQVARKGCLKC